MVDIKRVTSIVFSIVLCISMSNAHADDGSKKIKEKCQRIFINDLRTYTDNLNHPIRFGTYESQIPPGDEFQTYYLAAMLGEYRNKIDLTLYQKANNVLILSDGTTERMSDRLGPALARAFPKKVIVSAELNIVENKMSNNWGFVKIDNREPFPIQDNSFDRVILKRGMCICNQANCCAGFKPESAVTKQFISEVARVMNKNNPDAFAILHGSNNVGITDIAIWDQYLNEIEKTRPVRHEFRFDKGLFHSILIFPKP